MAKNYYIDYKIDDQDFKTIGPFSFNDGSIFFIKKLISHTKKINKKDFLLSSSFYLKEDSTKYILLKKNHVKVKNDKP